MSGRRAVQRPTLRDLLDVGAGVVTTAVAVSVGIWAVEGVRADGPTPVLVAAAAVGVGDLLLRPLLRLLAVRSGAVGALSTGVVGQFAVVWAALAFSPGVLVANAGSVAGVLVIASLVMAAGRWLLGANDSSYVLGDVLRRARSRARRGPPAQDGPPGLLVVMLDGVSRPVLLQAVESGLAPTLQRWLTRGSHHLAGWWARVPSTTPASQAGILHGDSSAVPAFRWWDKELGRMVVTNRPADAALVEARTSTGDGLLAHGGVAVSTMLSGDAPTSLLVMSTATLRSGLGPGGPFVRFFASPFVLSRALLLSGIEMVKELYQGRRQRVRRVEPRVPRRGAYVVLRGFTNVLLRDLTISLVAEHLHRGAPVVFVDLVDYDEIAHHAGPSRPEAMRALEGLDRALGLLEEVAVAAERDYRVVVVSDHGQSLGATFRQVQGISLDEAVRGAMRAARPEDSVAAGSTGAGSGEEWGPLNTLLTATLGRGPGRPPVELGPAPTGGDAGGELPQLATIASGNLGMAWFPRLPGRVALEDLQERWPHLVAELASLRAVGAVVVHSRSRGPLAVGTDGLVVLEDGTVEGTDPLLPFGSRARPDLLRLSGLATCGDLVLVSSVDVHGHVHAFEELVGSHGGIGGPQNDALLVHPNELVLDDALLETVDGREQLVGAEAVHLQLVRWLEKLGLRS